VPYDIPLYEVDSMFNNSFETTYNSIRVEIVHTWLDPEDKERYYIIKCREVFDELRSGNGGYNLAYSPWMLVDDIKLVDGFYLYKYFEEE
jgi:hypothetical protein